MIHLYYANRIEQLADALAENIAARTDSPLDALPVVVPNQAAKHFLVLAIAKKNGIAANLAFSFLRGLLEELATTKIPNQDQLATLILERLYDDAFLNTEDLAPVRRYLAAAGPDDVDRDRRRLGLATRLGHLFDTYALERPERLEHWRQGRAGETTTERWQRALYLALPEHDTLASAFADVTKLELPPAIHLFDLSVASPVLLSIVDRIAKVRDVFLYALNPCREYWEDVARFGVDAMERRLTGTQPEAPDDDPFGLLVDTDTPALRLWGRPGRESVRLLDQLSGSTFVARFESIEPDSVLHHVQRDVLDRRPERVVGEDALEPDASLRLHACPGVRREVEVIAEQIWSLVAASKDTDHPLRFNEIGVVLASRDREVYRAHLMAVFQEHGDIPHHVMDVPIAASSRIIEAIHLLCALPYSRYTRQDLLRLVTHPTVLARYDETNADEWTDWCEALLVVHGADKSDHAGTYIERDLYNWDQGLKRLVLGTFMAAEKSGEERAFEIAGDQYLPYEVSPSRSSSAARFGVLVRSLIADARFARDERLNLSEWSEFLHALVTTYLVATSDAEERDLVRALEAIHELADLDVEGLAVTFAAATGLLESRLENMTTNYGRPLANGVVIAPLSLAYALPFRVVFMPGLQEGRFPAPERPAALDLFAEQRRAGQVTPRERDQYAFLLRLLGTTEAVHLSYVATEQGTGDKREPAPTVAELMHLLERSYVGRDIEAMIVKHPLRRWTGVEGDRPFASRAAVREAGSRRLRSALLDHLDGDELPDLDLLTKKLAEPVRRKVASRLRLAELPPPRADDERLRSISLYLLRLFLESPLQGWASVVLGMDDDDREDPFAREDERFGTPAQIRDSALRAVLYAHARAPGTDLAELYHRRADYLELSGVLPTGVFGTAERQRHLDALETWKRELRRVSRGELRAIDPIRFGRGRENEVVRNAEPPFPVGVGDHVVELHGTTQPLLDEPSTSLVFVGRPGRKADRTLELRGFVDQVVLTAAGRIDDAHTVHVAFSEGDPKKARFDAFSTAEAKDYLTRLVTDLVSAPHAYALPFETVVRLQKARERKRKREMERILAEAPAARFGVLRDAQVRTLELDEAIDIVDRRFGPYFARRHGDD